MDASVAQIVNELVVYFGASWLITTTTAIIIIGRSVNIQCQWQWTRWHVHSLLVVQQWEKEQASERGVQIELATIRLGPDDTVHLSE